MHARVKKDFVVGASEQVVEAITKPGKGVGRVFNGDEELQLHGEVNDGAHCLIEASWPVRRVFGLDPRVY